MTSVQCLICDDADPFDQGLCPACGGAVPQGADSLLFLRTTGSWLEKQERLAAIIGERAESGEGREVAAGARALVRVPIAAVARVTALIEERGLSARAVPAERALLALPLQFLAMVTGVLVVGTYAGYVAMSVLGATSPVFALALVVYGHFNAQKPLLDGSGATSGLPRDVESVLVGALAELQTGTAREQLVDITRVARTVFTTIEPDHHDLRASVGELVTAACATALDVSRLDVTLASISEDGSGRSKGGTSLTGLRGRCATMREQRVDQLAQALRVLGMITSGAVDSQGGAGAQLGSVTRELTSEASAHLYAQREISELLS